MSALAKFRAWLCRIGLHSEKAVYRYCDDEVGRFFGPSLSHYVCRRCGKRIEAEFLHMEGD